MNQSELLENTLLVAREKSRVQCAIGFGQFSFSLVENLARDI